MFVQHQESASLMIYTKRGQHTSHGQVSTVWILNETILGKNFFLESEYSRVSEYYITEHIWIRKWSKVVLMLNGSDSKRHFKTKHSDIPNLIKYPPSWIPMYWLRFLMVEIIPIVVVMVLMIQIPSQIRTLKPSDLEIGSEF